jgi:cytochrome c oxidase subunit 2
MRHFIIAGFLVIITAVVTYLVLNAIGLMPVEASAQAIPIDWLWNWEVITISFLFALIVVPLLYSLIVFRRRKGDSTDAEHIVGNTKLEIGWSIAPLFLVMIFAYLGAYTLADTRRVDPDAMIVNVKASQWTWSFEYPEYGFTSNELHLPVNRQVLLKMESMDVIHSFWVPEFRVKQDVLPGRVTELRITPTLIGDTYKVRCAEMCGTSHYKMEQPVIVTSEADFTQWAKTNLAEFASAQTPEQRGERLAETYCFSCHSPTSTPVAGNLAPVWFGLFGSTVTFQDGSTVVADEAYIHESIVNPSAQIVTGYQPIMPGTYESLLSESEIANIIAFIMSLK